MTVIQANEVTAHDPDFYLQVHVHSHKLPALIDYAAYFEEGDNKRSVFEGCLRSIAERRCDTVRDYVQAKADMMALLKAYEANK